MKDIYFKKNIFFEKGCKIDSNYILVFFFKLIIIFGNGLEMVNDCVVVGDKNENIVGKI